MTAAEIVSKILVTDENKIIKFDINFARTALLQIDSSKIPGGMITLQMAVEFFLGLINKMCNESEAGNAAMNEGFKNLMDKYGPIIRVMGAMSPGDAVNLGLDAMGKAVNQHSADGTKMFIDFTETLQKSCFEHLGSALGEEKK